MRAIAAVVAAGLVTWSAVTPFHAFAAGTSQESGQTVQTQDLKKGTDVVFSTDYPGVSMKPGDTSTFTLYLTNDGDTQADVTLSAKDLPDGWKGSFKGSSNEVSMVHVGAGQTKDSSPSLNYSLTIPEDAKEDSYTITLNAKGDSVDEDLPLTVKVDKEEKGSASGTFTADYAEQEGVSGGDFTFSATLQNNGAQNQNYALTADGAPDGWTVAFTPSGASSATSAVPVDAGASSTISIKVTPAQNVSAGEYKITVKAEGGSESLELPLTVKITGTYDMTLTTPSGNLSAKAYAGEKKSVKMVVQNSGNVDLKNVKLSAQASTDWNVTFDQDTIDQIKAGESADVTATITPAKDSVIGDYVAAITAATDSTSSECDLRVSVQNHTSWGIVAVVIIAALVAGLWAVIRKFGRR